MIEIGQIRIVYSSTYHDNNTLLLVTEVFAESALLYAYDSDEFVRRSINWINAFSGVISNAD